MPLAPPQTQPNRPYWTAKGMVEDTGIALQWPCLLGHWQALPIFVIPGKLFACLWPSGENESRESLNCLVFWLVIWKSVLHQLLYKILFGAISSRSQEHAWKKNNIKVICSLCLTQKRNKDKIWHTWMNNILGAHIKARNSFLFHANTKGKWLLSLYVQIYYFKIKQKKD